VRTVGVMGDSRTYDEWWSWREVTSTDGMTADFLSFEWLSSPRRHRIINEGRGVTPRVYDVTSKPPGRSSGSLEELRNPIKG